MQYCHLACREEPIQPHLWIDFLCRPTYPQPFVNGGLRPHRTPQPMIKLSKHAVILKGLYPLDSDHCGPREISAPWGMCEQFLPFNKSNRTKFFLEYYAPKCFIDWCRASMSTFIYVIKPVNNVDFEIENCEVCLFLIRQTSGIGSFCTAWVRHSDQ